MSRLKIILLGIAFIFGTGIYAQDDKGNDFEIYKNLELFELVYKSVDLNYVDEPVPGHLMKTAIDAMLKELDPYSVYIPESKIEDFKLMTTGQYGGIGALIQQQDGKVLISDPYEGFPAQKSGLMAGDVFIEINGQNVEELNSEQISEKLKGQPGSELTIKVERQDKIIEKKLTREEIKLPTVPYYGMINENVGYIKLNSFTRTAASETLDAFQDLKKNKGMTKLVYDLRGNPGGLLLEAVKIVNFWVQKGEEVVWIKGRNGGESRDYKAALKPEDLDIPIVVLIDENSASASEIVSGALQDLDRAVILGQTSFGKGLVQRPFDLKYNAKIKITIAKYYTPSGRCIQKLDYTHREAGSSAKEISDENLRKFKTRNGREVVDGRGIEPDVNIDKKEYSRLTKTLVLNHVFFEYATKFRIQNEDINGVREFKIDDAAYKNFVQFVLAKDFEYSTASGDKMKELKEIAEKEGYYENAAAEFDALFEKFKPSKERDLEKFRAEIIEILEDEIIGRYYYQKGRIEHSLVEDEFILEAVKILNDDARYKDILKIEN